MPAPVFRVDNLCFFVIIIDTEDGLNSRNMIDKPTNGGDPGKADHPFGD